VDWNVLVYEFPDFDKVFWAEDDRVVEVCYYESIRGRVWGYERRQVG